MCSVETGLEQNYCDLSLSSATPSFFPSFFFYDDHVGVERVRGAQRLHGTLVSSRLDKEPEGGTVRRAAQGGKNPQQNKKRKKEIFFFMSPKPQTQHSPRILLSVLLMTEHFRASSGTVINI